MRYCEIENCNKKHLAGGLCAIHYYQTDKARNKQKQRRDKNKDYNKKYGKKYYQENKPKLNEINQKWAEDNRERSREIKRNYKKRNPNKDKEYYESHKKQHNERMVKWRKNNKDYVSNYNKKYKKEHPEKKLESDRKSLQKLFDMGCFKEMKNSLELEAAYRSWANSVKKRDENTCQVCGRMGSVAHHILYKSTYPKLSLVIDNGITLCNICHNEIHHSL